MRLAYDSLIDALEELVDRSSLHETLDALDAVARLKADHLSNQWQDRAAAKSWIRVATKVAQAAAAAKKEGL